MGLYEGMFILSPDVDGESLEKEIDYLKNEIVKLLGEISEAKALGKRRLAYPINKVKDGFYLLINFAAKSDIIDPFLKKVRLNPNVLRAQVFKKEKHSISEIRAN